MSLPCTLQTLLLASSRALQSLLPLAGLFTLTLAGCSDEAPPDVTTGGGTMGLPGHGGPPPEPTVAPDDLPGFKGSRACQKCHTALYEDWKSSMHAHALTSPVMITQTNQVFAADLSKSDNAGREQLCVVCHGPTTSLFAEGGTLPFVGVKPNATTKALKEGIGCVTCHAYRGDPEDSAAALVDFEQDFAIGKSYFGPFSDPAPNGGYHQSLTSSLYESGPEKLCLNCHNLKVDRDGDKKFTLGEDLFLQTTFDEYSLDYRQNGGGTETCLGCHMSERPESRKAADGFPDAPLRTVHNHTFAGVDYPLDLFAEGNDPQKFARRELLSGHDAQHPVAALKLENAVSDGKSLSFDVAVTNANAGHNLPTGFAFMRQMWLEVIVTDAAKNELGASGKLLAPSDDLCDKETLGDNLGPVVEGCQGNVADPQLVNFQTQLVDFVALRNGVLVKDPLQGHETWLEFQTGGAVFRSRPADVAAGPGLFTLAPLKPFETRLFHYAFNFAQQTGNMNLSVTLKFRNLPPYFVRRLAQGDSSQVLLSSLLSFEVVDMAATSLTVAL